MKIAPQLNDVSAGPPGDIRSDIEGYTIFPISAGERAETSPKPPSN
jgi:hypothetical protein